MLVIGCGGGKSPNKTASKAPEKEEPARELFTEAGDATRFSEEGERRKLWTVKWGTAYLRYGSEGQVGGTMDGVTGQLYKDDKVVSTYKAQKAIADEVTGELTLQGEVEVFSPEQKSTLRSETLIWASKGREIIKAKGRVRLESPLYLAGEVPELWAEPDLSRVATPEVFDNE